MTCKITIEYCTKCKWQNRAFWYLQELLQTFDGKIHEISLRPILDPPGTFKVILQTDHGEKIIYRKKMKVEKGDEPATYEGFPDSKFLKILVRNEIEPNLNLGHIDKYLTKLNDGSNNSNQPTDVNNETKDCNDCTDCSVKLPNE